MNQATRAAKFKLTRSVVSQQDKEQRPTQNHQDQKHKHYVDASQKPLSSKTNTVYAKSTTDMSSTIYSSTSLVKPLTSYKNIAIQAQIEVKWQRYVNILSKAHFRFSLRHQSFIRSILILDRFLQAKKEITIGTLLACFFLAAKTQEIYFDGFGKYSHFFKFEEGLTNYMKYEFQVLKVIKFDVNWKDGPYYNFSEYDKLRSVDKHVKFYIQYLLEIVCLNRQIYKEFSWKIVVETIYGYLESPLVPNQKFNSKNEACLTKILRAMKAAIKKDYVYAKYCGAKYQNIAMRPVPKIGDKKEQQVVTETDQEITEEKDKTYSLHFNSKITNLETDKHKN